LNEFLLHLRERKLVQWGLAYVAAAFASLQGIDIVAGKFGWPESIERALIIVLSVGLFVTLLLAWYHGEQARQRVSGTELALLVLVFGFGGFLLWRVAGAPVAPHVPAERAPGETPASRMGARSGAPIPAKSIAVLPFENLSRNEDNAYFVSGMQDLILTNLSKIGDLKVISRTSTEKYASRPDDLRTIGLELGVATLLEGSVQRVGNQVLINLQLIEAQSDSHLWAESYDRKLEDIFSVEQEVAKTVAAALQAKLSASETASIASKPTANAAAYELFLRAEFLSRRGYENENRETLQQAIDLYRQAVSADPLFALAYTKLSITCSELYWYSNDVVALPGVAQCARDAALAAERIQPGQPESLLATGIERYRVSNDLAGALHAFDAALSIRPGYLDATYGRALVLRRLGRFTESLAATEAVAALDPRDSNLAAEVGDVSAMQRRYASAERGFRRALAVDPDNVFARHRLAQVELLRSGDADAALALLHDDQTMGQLIRIEMLGFQRQYQRAIDLLATMPDRAFGDAGVPGRNFWAGSLQYAAGRRAEALPLLRRAAADSQRAVGAFPPGSSRGGEFWFAWAQSEALLGNADNALAIAARALATLPVDGDVIKGSDALARAAKTYALLGREDLVLPALQRLRELAGADMTISAGTLRGDPVWDKVRQNAQFQAEIARFAEVEKAAEPE
jgi:TolB-like protein/Tfp pilus assembly protein PilF